MGEARYVLVGAGAIAEQLYLRLFDGDPSCDLVVLERDQARRTELRGRFPSVNFTGEAVDSLAKQTEFKAGFICLPNYLHAEYIQKFVDLSIPVLVEKPVVNTTDAFDGIDFSAASVVWVAHVRRYFGSSRFLREIVRAEIFGRVLSVYVSDGGPFQWRMKSDYLLSRDKAGGGVLMDSGIHWIDLLIWLLGDLDLVSYEDNAFGGVESECVVKFRFSSGEGGLRLTRVRGIRRRVSFEFEGAYVDYDLDASEGMVLRLKRSKSIEIRHSIDDSLRPAFVEMISQFRDMVDGEVPDASSLLPDAREGLKAVEFVERCYGFVA